jgi:hypothetical protein
MRTVRDDDGNRYLMLTQSADAVRVRDPTTGEERYLPKSEVTVLEGESPLETAAIAVPQAVRQFLTATPNDQAIGLLVDLDARGPLAVEDLLAAYELCESDLHGMLAEFRAAGLVEEAAVAGHRGYETTETASEAIEYLRP